MNKGKLKITKEQYNRIFASGLINENQMPKVKGGLDRVDKAFKREFKGKSLTEGEDQIKKETLDLIKYLYRKSDEFSPFWAENNLSYDDICDALEASKIIIKKDGAYELSKSLGSPEKAIQAVEEELRAMLSNDETPKSDLDEGDWFDYLPNHPANQPDPQYKEGTKVKNPSYKVLSYNREMALLKGEDGNVYAFYIDGVDRKDFEEYADLEVIDTYPDGEGGYDVEYSDEWEIDDDVIQNYVNDNLGSLRMGKGLADWEDGDYQLVLVDDELRQDLLNVYDKDANLVKVLGGGLNEETEDERMARLKAVIAKKRAESQKYEDEYFKRRDIKNQMDSDREEEKLRQKNIPKPEEPKKPVGQYNMFGGVDEMSAGGMGGTNTASVGGQYTPALDMPVVKKPMMEDSDLGAGYTHFAILKATGQIVDGWDYTDVDNDSIKYYTKLDLTDNFPENKLSEFKVVTRKALEKSGINPADTNNWYRPNLNETLDVAGAGNFQYDTPGGLTMDLGKNNPKTKAETKTQWAGGSFVEFNDCVKLNNKPAGAGCSAGAVDNVVKLKKSKGNVNAPSLGENKIYEAIAKKTGKTIDEVKAIIASKNNKG